MSRECTPSFYPPFQSLHTREGVEREAELMSRCDFVSVALGLAERQHGVVARRQLLAAGFGGQTVSGRVQSGYLTRIFRGTYAVGRGEVSQRGLWMAGVLASGDGAALARRSAAAAWGFLRIRPAVDTIRVGDACRQRASVRLAETTISVPLSVRRTRRLPDEHVTSIDRIPVTTVERTLLDLSALVSASEYRRAWLEADRLGLLSDSSLAALLVATKRGPGRAGFRRQVAGRIDLVAEARSILEALHLDVCLEFGFELPEVNTKVCGFEVDSVWPRRRLVVELDSYEFHRGRENFEKDIARANELRTNGWSLLRFTWRMVTADPDRVSAQIKAALEGSQLSQFRLEGVTPK